jgi:hypothetical protein
MRKKRITIPRGSLSPFTASAILQLMQEFNRKEDVKQCLALAKVFKERAAKLKKEPCRQPSNAKKRTEADKLARAAAFAKIKAGTYSPAAVAASLAEATAAGQEYRQEYQPPAAPVPAVPTAYELNAATSAQIQREIDGEDDDWQPQPPACPAQRPWTPPPQASEPAAHEESGYEMYWRRQEEAQRAQEASGNARTVQQPEQPVTPAAPEPAAPRPPQKGEPGYVGYLLEEIDRRKAAGTWKPE